MPHTYENEDDYSSYDRESAALRQTWDAFAKDFNLAMQVAQAPIHIPPALDGFLCDLLGMSKNLAHQDATKGDQQPLEAYEIRTRQLLSFIFYFGQYCLEMPEPISFEDLTHCTCGTVTDEDIEQLLRG